jgi:uncharacterized protein YdeI (YjbR/CyaY-like superfamily)
MRPHANRPGEIMDMTFFASPAAFRAWLARHHATAQELWVGFYKKSSGQPSITWPESVDQALCFGWIDGIRKSIDAISYAQRFTPRRPGSNWSAVNIRRVAELTQLGLMQPAGLAAFEARRAHRSEVYSYEEGKSGLDPVYEAQLQADPRAWDYFQAQAPWYRRTACHWVMSAKQEATRLRRLASLIDCCERGVAIPPLSRLSRSP